MKYIEFTKEQIYSARQCDIMDFLAIYEGFAFKKCGNSYFCIEHDSLVVKKDRRGWFWNSKNLGGSSAIDYCQKVRGLNFTQSVATLIGDNLIKQVNTEKTADSMKKKQFFLPPKTDGQYSRLFAYLEKTRGIEVSILLNFVEKNKMYQDKKGNIVFVGVDEKGTAKYASIKGTLTDIPFRGEVEGSDKKYSFSSKGKNKEKVYVFESPIDLLSHCTLTNMRIGNKKAYTVHNRLSLSCVADVALEQYLSSNKDITNIIFCLDNDKAGREATDLYINKYFEKGYTVSSVAPLNKDFNEDLLQIRKESQRKNAHIIQK